MSQAAPNPHLRHIKDSVQNLVRFRGTTRLYGPQHRFAERFLVSFADSVQLGSPDQGFEIDVQDTGFFYEGELLARGTPARELAQLLHEEGLRRMGFRRGTERGELFKLAQLLVLPWDRRTESDEDLISMLWRADFRQVDLLVVERFQEVLGESGDAALREDLALGRKLGAERGRLVGDSVQVDDIDWEALVKETMEAARQFRMKQDEAALYLRFRRQLDFRAEERLDAHQGLFKIAPKQRRALEEELAQVQEEQDVDQAQAAWILFDLVRIAREGGSQEQIGALAAKGAIELIDEARPQAAADLVRRCQSFKGEGFPGVLSSRNFLLGFGVLVGEHRERLAEGYSKLGDPVQSAPSLFTLLSLVHKEHSDRLFALLPLLQHLAHQLVVVDLLRLNKQLDLNQLAETLSQTSGVEAILPLLALWREGAGRGRQQAWRLLQDEDPRTREAALRALRGDRSPRLVDHLVQALADDSPGPRIEALRHAALVGGPKLRPLLEQSCRVESLLRLEVDEMRAWCTAFAVAAKGAGQVELGRVLLEERPETANGLFVRAACAHALRASRAPQATQAIDKALRRWPELGPLLAAGGAP